MSTQRTTDPDVESEESLMGYLARGRTAIERHGRRGTLALAGGAALLLRSVRKGGGGRSAPGTLAGIALVAFGLRQRRGGGDESPVDAVDDAGFDPETETSVDAGGGGDVSDDASAELERPATEVDSGQESPRDPGTPGADEDEGDVQFTHEQDEDVEPKPESDAAGAGDPRHDVDSDEAGVEIDISEAAMADESGEAAGPTSQQSEPTSTRDDPTEPEGDDADAVTEDAEEKRVDPDEETGEDRDRTETEEGTTIHTDTNEAGTIDVDEDDVTDPDHDLNEEPAEADQQDPERLDDVDETTDDDTDEAEE